MALTKTELLEAQQKKLQQLIDDIPKVLKKTKDPKYDEIFGYRIAPDDVEYVDVSKRNEILLKFLIARDYDVAKAEEMIVKTLNWRREFQVLSAAYNEEYDPELEKIGVITDFGKGNKKNFRVVTWNIYANLKSPKKLFAKLGEGEENSDKTEKPGTMFLRWRVGLMERSLLLLQFDDPENNKIAQVHDYNNVSMFRMDPGMKQATKEIISVFSDNYPELLSKKYFVNVPLFMGWVFTFFKMTGLISALTILRFEMLNHSNLSDAFGKDNLPKEYNGGTENKKVPSIYSLEVSGEAETPTYAKVMLDRLSVNVDEVD